MSKYERPVREVLRKDLWMSANQVKTELEQKLGKNINWYIIDKVLRSLEQEGAAQSIRHDRIVLWKKK